MILTYEASETKSVNTIYLHENKIIGHNTDILKTMDFNLV